MIEQIASRFNATKQGSAYIARCPAHDDSKASLSIFNGRDGRPHLECHAGCDFNAILRASGLTAKDLMPDSMNGTRQTANGSKPHIVATYDYKDESGVLLFQAVRFEPKDFRQRQPDGKGRWKWSLAGVRRVLYRLPELLTASATETVFVVEGEKDVEALRKLGLIATCNPMGASKSGQKTKWSDKYTAQLKALQNSARRIVVLPDNDDPGRAHADAIAKSIRRNPAGISSFKILALPDLPDKGDVSDWLARGGTRETLLALVEDTAEQTGAKKGRTVITGDVTFSVNENGVYATGDNNNTKPVCSPLWIEATTHDERNGNWGRLLRFPDPDGNIHTWAMPSSLLSGDRSAYEAFLRDQGLLVFSSRLLQTYLDSRSEKRVMCVSRTGWHRGAFVLPDECIGGKDGQEIHHQSAEGGNYLMRTSGTAEEWKENVGRYGAGNSRLLLAMSAGFAAVLLEKLGVESGGFHFRGTTSEGKSITLITAGSIWGGGSDKGFLRRWRATINGLESVAESHNDGLLCLDEVAEVDPREAGETAYMLANGQGKLRQSKAITLRRPLEWRLIFLSSGEISLADHMATVGKKVRGGMEVRLVDLPADAGKGYGVFENIHGFESSKAFAQTLEASAKRYYGTAIRAFLRGLAKESDADLKKAWKTFQADFQAKHCPKGSRPEVGRVCDRFALAAFAGEAATEAGIAGWSEGEATEAAAKLFDEWLKGRGTNGSSDEAAMIRQVRAFIERHGASRFQRVNPPDERTIHDRAGLIDRTDEGAVYYFSREVFQGEVCKGFDHAAVARILETRNFLITNHGRQFKRWNPETGKMTPFYAVTDAILDGE